MIISLSFQTVVDLRRICLDIYNRMIYYAESDVGVYKRPMDLSVAASVLIGTGSMEAVGCSYGHISGYVRKVKKRNNIRMKTL